MVEERKRWFAGCVLRSRMRGARFANVAGGVCRGATPSSVSIVTAPNTRWGHKVARLIGGNILGLVHCRTKPLDGSDGNGKSNDGYEMRAIEVGNPMRSGSTKGYQEQRGPNECKHCEGRI